MLVQRWTALGLPAKPQPRKGKAARRQQWVYLEVVDMDVKASPLAITDGVYEALICFAEDPGLWINEAFTVRGVFTGHNK